MSNVLAPFEHGLAFIGLPIVPMLCKNEARAFDPTV